MSYIPGYSKFPINAKKYLKNNRASNLTQKLIIYFLKEKSENGEKEQGIEQILKKW